MNPATAIVAAPPRPKETGPFNPKPRRNKPHDLGTDRSSAYNKLNNTEIANNHMLDRFLRNQEELRKMGVHTQ